MNYLVIAEWNADFHPSRASIVGTKQEATNLVSKLINDMPSGKDAPNAFYVPNPTEDTEYIVVDPANKTITVETGRAALEASLILWEELRTKRDQLLHDTDWWASSDLSISEDQTSYRQSLRDLPANTPDPADPTWPVAPA